MKKAAFIMVIALLFVAACYITNRLSQNTTGVGPPSASTTITKNAISIATTLVLPRDMVDAKSSAILVSPAVEGWLDYKNI